MRNKFFVLFFVLTLFASALPAAAKAAKQQTFEISVRNRTHGSVEVKVIGSDGVAKFFKLPAGFSTLSMPEGTYQYWVSSSCGNSAGKWNLNVNKTLWVDCSSTGNAAWVAKNRSAASCSDYGFLVDWNTSPSQTWWAFLSQSHWDYTTLNFDSETQRIIDLGFNITWGCETDFVYDEYYIGL
jgi:hypothetical protein